ncbi:MAG: PIN domain-containing protein [Ruminococcus sp.]|nr:PIN domain-containing protein [Ruminococcus sp.]
MKVLLDTCVVVDALQKREPFSEDAENIFLAVANWKIEGYITAKSVTDIYYLTHRLTHSDAATRDILNKLFSLFGILDTTANDCREAVFSDVTDYEDAVMIVTAEREKMDYIVTRNIRDYAKSKVPVLTPAELMNRIVE